MGKSIIIKGADFSDNALDITRYNISYSLTNINELGSTLPAFIKQGGSRTIKFAKTFGYGYPSSVAVVNATSSYDSTTGVLTISNPTGSVYITAAGAADSSPSIGVSAQFLSFSSLLGDAEEKELTIYGLHLNGAISIAFSGTGASSYKAKYNGTEISSISAADAEQGKTIKIVFDAQGTGTHAATLTLSSSGAENIVVALSGTANQSLDITSLFTTWNANSCYFVAQGDSAPSLSNSTVFETSNAVDISSFVGKKIVFSFLDYTPGSGGTATVSSVIFGSNSSVLDFVTVGSSGQNGVGVGKTAEMVIPSGASTFIATYPNATKRTQFNMSDFSAYITNVSE